MKFAAVLSENVYTSSPVHCLFPSISLLSSLLPSFLLLLSPSLPLPLPSFLSVLSRGRSFSPCYRFMSRWGDWVWVRSKSYMLYNPISHLPEGIAIYTWIVRLANLTSHACHMHVTYHVTWCHITWHHMSHDVMWCHITSHVKCHMMSHDRKPDRTMVELV